MLPRDLAEAATALSAARTEAAERLADEVTAELALLAMPHARLVASRCAPTARPGSPSRPVRGSTTSSCCSPPTPGSEPRPLDKGASGGELSRVMLALEVALAGTNPVPTFVFDEVDAGVGGKAAVEVGRRLACWPAPPRSLVVTHLPQVAAFADRHVVVDKSADGTVTTSGLTVLDDAERVRELSRMLAGLEDSDTALAHARELLEVARSARRRLTDAPGSRGARDRRSRWHDGSA